MGRKTAIALVGALAIGAVLWWRQSEQPAEVPVSMRVQLPLPIPAQPVPRAATAKPAAISEDAETQADIERIPVPGRLDGSDDMARTAAHELSPMLLKWLIAPEQIRKWVALIDALADGKMPSTKIQPLAFPMPAFDVISVDDATRMNPNNFTRAKLLIDTLTSMDAQKLADYYHAWSPLLETAYAELGRSDNFDTRLRRALQNLLDAPVLPETADLARPKAYYVYADPALEKSSDVTKLLWRLGTANQRQLQSYVGLLLPML